MESLKQKLIIPDELHRAASEAGVDIAKNKENFPILSREFSETERRNIAKTKQALLKLPLTHSSSRETAGDLKPHSAMPAREYSHTGQLDIDLGLNRCVFMQWGAVEKSGGYGRFHTLVDPEKLFEDPRSFVTPYDITHATFTQNVHFEATTPQQKEHIKNQYFSKILSGSDWLELTARETYLQTRKGEGLVIGSGGQLGEVKFFGVIPKDYVSKAVGPYEEHAEWADMFMNGFIAGPVHRSRYAMNDYDTTPAELGLTGTEASDFWRNLYQSPVASTMLSESVTIKSV